MEDMPLGRTRAELAWKTPERHSEYQVLNISSFNLQVYFYLTAMLAYEVIAENSTFIS